MTTVGGSIACHTLTAEDFRKLEAENARLRAALEKIERMAPSVTHGWAESARQIARAALKGEVG
jgi:hypothetical protein